MNAAARKPWALLLALVLVLAWGSNYSVQKALLAQIGPQAMIFIRYVLTPACALAVLLWRYGLAWPRLGRGDWAALAGLALVGHVAHVSVMTHAMHLSTPFSSALISACGPVFTLLIVRLLWNQRLLRVQLVGVVLAMAGVLVFLSDKLADPRAQGLGDLLLLLATVLFASHTVAAKAVIERHGVLLVMAYSTLLASVPLLAMNAPVALQVAWSGLPPAAWLALVWSVAFASFAGWLIWGWLNAELGVPRSAPLLYLLPPVAGLISWATLGEAFGSLKLLGAGMAVAGVAAVQFGPAALQRRARQST
ncbi:DMT family transporter [Ramlibacter tataouinensis]|uniref:DMT family transporter n=1 Tax=Ramlibacter tataouinensis TaxID=94132 RepID=UPI0022F3BE42|nr:DMT family transporter [Ramlibacter tataouinensis]WBY03073.1 DMT family transporter [Ramlibacter tataouinensis]